MPNPSIRRRLAVTMLLILAVSGALQASGYLLERSKAEALGARLESLLKLGDAVHALQDAIDSQHAKATEYLFDGSLGAIAAYEVAKTSEADVVASSAALVAQFPAVADGIRVYRAAAESWRTGFMDSTIALVESGRAIQARSILTTQAGAAAYAPVLDAHDALDAQMSALHQAAAADMDRIGAEPALALLVNILVFIAGTVVAHALLGRWLGRPLRQLLAVAGRIEAGEDARFPTDQDGEFGLVGQALERMRAGLSDAAREASVVNRFTELTAFVEADGDVARAALDALGELVEPSEGTIHIANPSKDRAIAEGSLGDVAPKPISLGQMSSCPGVRRGGLYVSNDLGERLGVRCPLYGAETGTLACIPLIALGEVVGVAHLHWQGADEFPLDIQAAMARITEHASLAIANRRLMVALQGMATTDGRTGLANSRAFDEALQVRLAALGTDRRLSVLILDIDHFKDFNDRNGHPAGDQALRSFARVLEASIRDGDMAARYGGEEFTVMLPDASEEEAAEVAERIRSQVEAMTIDLSPGHRDQVTVSIGLATWPMDAEDRVQLLEVADAALYRAKSAGRNRVVLASQAFKDRAVPETAQEPGPEGPLPGPISLSRPG